MVSAACLHPEPCAGKVIVAHGDARVSLVDLVSGRPEWTISLESAGDTSVCGVPAPSGAAMDFLVRL